MRTVAQTSQELDAEASRLTEMLRHKEVVRVWRHRPGELGIEFANGTRLFVDWQPTGLEMSVTGGAG